jgi:hypothetical protein
MEKTETSDVESQHLYSKDHTQAHEISNSQRVKQRSPIKQKLTINRNIPLSAAFSPQGFFTLDSRDDLRVAPFVAFVTLLRLFAPPNRTVFFRPVSCCSAASSPALGRR